ncbi:MAG: hypothetical protein ACXWNK_17235 [Vulcanimicrobiaceae bacterium]
MSTALGWTPVAGKNGREKVSEPLTLGAHMYGVKPYCHCDGVPDGSGDSCAIVTVLKGEALGCGAVCAVTGKPAENIANTETIVSGLKIDIITNL